MGEFESHIMLLSELARRHKSGGAGGGLEGIGGGFGGGFGSGGLGGGAMSEEMPAV